MDLGELSLTMLPKIVDRSAVLPWNKSLMKEVVTNRALSVYI